jgi:arginyl-tRNA synthetase
MKDQLIALLEQTIDQLKVEGFIPAETQLSIKLERCRDSSHGDFASNIAMMLAKPCQKAPKQVAQTIVNRLANHPQIHKVEIAGPGFINFHLKADSLNTVIATVLDKKEHFGESTVGQAERVLVEFVSANPTGPLHVGHGRGAAIGASLCNLLNFAGYEVTREYYVNDGGRQMNILAVSVWMRYLLMFDESLPFPRNGYQGDYVVDIAKQCLDEVNDQYVVEWAKIKPSLPADESEGGDKEQYIDALIHAAQQAIGEEGFGYFHHKALTDVLDDIKEDLSEFGVHFDHWYSEKSLMSKGKIDDCIADFKAKDLTYEQDGALWFRAMDFGDEKDRVMRRANGQVTYFASDAAYHWDKYQRGFQRIIDLFGADHHGYVSRIRAAVEALGHDPKSMDVLLVQFAILYRGQERVQMSTRSGSFVTLRELREEVGNDAARFFYVIRKAEQHMDFDLELAKSKSNENPVYYIQYAHARICSVFAQLEKRGYQVDQNLGLDHLQLLDSDYEQTLIQTISRFPEVVERAAVLREPHLVAYYLKELATALHSYYNAIILLCEDINLRNARMCLLLAVRHCLANGLQLLGVSAPKSM